MSWMKRQKKMKQKFLQLLPLVAADLQLLCPVPLRKGSRVCLTDESILSGLSWEERGERNLIPRNVLIDFSSLGSYIVSTCVLELETLFCWTFLTFNANLYLRVADF